MKFPCYMTHEDNGAMHVYDKGEYERAIATGWTATKMPTADEIRAAKRGETAAQLRAQLAQIEAAEVVAAAAEKKKPGRKPKVVA